MIEQGEQLNYLELLEKIKGLRGIYKRYYEYLPNVCWKTEATQAREMNIGRTKLRRVKDTLIKAGLLKLELLPNGKRNNPKHILLKTYPIILMEREREYCRYSLEDDYSYSYYINDIDWSLLQSYTAEDINKMSKLDKIQLYMDCGFIVLPTHYPIFTNDGVKCSCKRGYDCPNKGKHPIFCYKNIDSYHYQFIKENYIRRFKYNPEWNIGFKVMGFSVLDVDFRHNGDSTLEDLKQHYDFDTKGCLTVNSGNGHHIYASNKGLKNIPNALGDGLDIRSDKGFIMAPGSLHYSKKHYEWNLIGELADLPIELDESDSDEDSEDKVNKKGSSIETTRIKLKDITLPKTLTSDYLIKKGTRELTLYKWGCRERGKGVNADQIYDILITIRDTYCEEGDEPVTNEEVRDIATCAAKHRTNHEKLLMALKP